MAPPTYNDLGKQARDLFSKNYHFGLVKLDVKTKTPTGVDFTVNCVSNNDTGRVNSALETKYLVKDYGLTLREKWNTDNILTSEVTFEDKLLKGFKLSGNLSFAPQSGKKTGAVKAAFKTDALHINSDVDLDYAGAILHGAAVLGYQGWLAGAQLSFDPAKNRLTRTNFAIGYTTPELIIHTNVDDGQKFAGSIYQKVNSQLESGVHMAWAASSNVTTFGLGCVYKLDDNSTLRAKVSNTSQIGLGFTHRLRTGIILTLNALIDGKNFNQGGHKLGLGFDLEA
jgi:voltage-dependent anion channel protein 2